MVSSGEIFEFEARSGRDTMSARSYIAILSLFIMGGLILATFVASFTYSMEPNWIWLVGYFALAIPGVMMSANSDNWMVSFIGYLMVIFPTGAIVGPYVHLYTITSVIEVVCITIGVSFLIGVAGVIYPKSVEHWGGFLLTGLLILIMGDVVRAIMTFYGIPLATMGLWDWVGVILFSGFIFYDMNRAMQLPKTMDNAVDSAVALYLDIFNLFIRLLAIMGKKNDD